MDGTTQVQLVLLDDGRFGDMNLSLVVFCPNVPRADPTVDSFSAGTRLLEGIHTCEIRWLSAGHAVDEFDEVEVSTARRKAGEVAG